MEIHVIRREPMILTGDGIPLAEAQIALPKAPEDTKACRAVNHFYGRIGDALEGIAKEILVPLSRKLYEESEDPRRRFTHRPFRLLCECKIAAVEGGVLVKRILLIKHRGRTVFERCDREIVCEDGLILPWKEKSPK